MGCDWYDFSSFCSSGAAIMVTNKCIKEVRSPGSSQQGMVLLDKLNDEDLSWLFDQAQGFKLYNLEDSFVLFMNENGKVVPAPTLHMPGPYGTDEYDENFRFVEFRIEETSPETSEFRELFDLARKLTPSSKKVMFQPGQYIFSLPNVYYMSVKELRQPNKKLPTATTESAVPVDFELVIGKGESQEVIEVNKSVLFCMLPGLEACLAGKVEASKKLEFPELDPAVVKLVLDHYCTRKTVELRDRYGWFLETVEPVAEAFGLEKKEGGSPASKKAKKENPALTDPGWLDATFLVGPNKVEVKANRAVLASMNPVLRRILYGTGMISVDPSKPIEWPEFEAEAVRTVFQALVHGGKKEFVVPTESMESVKAVVGYILETFKDLKLRYTEPFECKFLKGTKLMIEEDDDTAEEGFCLED